MRENLVLVYTTMNHNRQCQLLTDADTVEVTSGKNNTYINDAHTGRDSAHDLSMKLSPCSCPG